MTKHEDFDRLIVAEQQKRREAAELQRQKAEEQRQIGERNEAYGRYAAQRLMAAHVQTEEVRSSKNKLFYRTIARGWLIISYNDSDPGQRYHDHGLILCTNGDFRWFSGAEWIYGTHIIVTSNGLSAPVTGEMLGGYHAAQIAQRLTSLLADNLPGEDA